MWVGRPEGTHFAADGRSPLAFSDEGTGLEGQARFASIEDDDDEDADAQDEDQPEHYKSNPEHGDGWKLLLGGAFLVVALGVLWAAPRIKALVVGRRAQKAALEQAAEGEESAPAIEGRVINAVKFTGLVEAVVEDPPTIMSSTEARQRLVECMLAAAVIAGNIRAFRNVKVEAGDGFNELETEQVIQLEHAIEQLTVPQLTDTINQLIEADHTLLGEEQMTELHDTFGGGYLAEGKYVPLKKKKVRKALRTAQE